MDELEKLITGNKDQFNDHIPSPEIWDNIEKELAVAESKRFSIVKFLSAGAAAVMLLLVGVWFGINFRVDDMDKAISNSSFADYKQTEQYYAVQVKNYLTEIKELDAESNIEEELKQLDEVYQELREELLASGVKNQDIIINAMIKNYQIKIGMLERIVDKNKAKELNKEIKKYNNEKISI